MLTKVQEWRKAIATAIGSVLTVLTLLQAFPFLPDNVTATVAWLLAAGTTLVTWLVPNKTPA